MNRFVIRNNYPQKGYTLTYKNGEVYYFDTIDEAIGHTQRWKNY